MLRKIEAMHSLFGTDPSHRCADCDHLCSHLYNRRYYKCEIYGDSNSEATDWAKSWVACGLIDNESTADEFTAEWGTVMHYLQQNRPQGPTEQIEGQMCMEDFL